MQTKDKETKFYIKNCISNFNGITLIALIITIIVLLILAVVTINAVQGDGIINYAKKAKKTYQEEQDKENISIALNEYKIAKYAEDTEKSLAEFLEEKKWCASATENEDGSIDVTTKEGKLYRIENNGDIQTLTGISLSKKQISLQLENGKTITEELTATLNEIEGNIIWSNEKDEIATINSTIGRTINITAKTVGETTITATCGEYSATCKVTVTDPIDVSKAPFVEYDVTYTDVYVSSNVYNKNNGWRLLSAIPNEDGTYSDVKLISTGIPAMLSYKDGNVNNNWFVKEESKILNFRELLKEKGDFVIPADVHGMMSYRSLWVAAGLYYNFGQIEFAYSLSSRGDDLGYFSSISIPNNNSEEGRVTYDSSKNDIIIGEDLFNLYKKNATVRLLTLPELNEVLNKKDGEKIDSDYSGIIDNDQVGLFVITNLNNVDGMNEFVYPSSGCLYALASPAVDTNNTGLIVSVQSSGRIGSNNLEMGLRPVICLNSKVNLVDQNNDGVFELKLVNN